MQRGELGTQGAWGRAWGRAGAQSVLRKPSYTSGPVHSPAEMASRHREALMPTPSHLSHPYPVLLGALLPRTRPSSGNSGPLRAVTVSLGPRTHRAWHTVGSSGYLWRGRKRQAGAGGSVLDEAAWLRSGRRERAKAVGRTRSLLRRRDGVGQWSLQGEATGLAAREGGPPQSLLQVSRGGSGGLARGEVLSKDCCLGPQP